MKAIIKNSIIVAVNATGISSRYLGTPKGVVDTRGWVENTGSRQGGFFKEIYPARTINDPSPVSIEPTIHKLYHDELERTQYAAFVACIPHGRTWGCCGIAITPDDRVLTDVSREFGKYGGVFGEELSVFRRLSLSRVQKLGGRVALLASAGSSNYHHWLYDTLPKIHLLKKAGLFEGIDSFIIDHKELPFQLESLKALGVDLQKIIKPENAWNFHIQADELIVSSLPSRLGTVSDWVVSFIRDTFLNGIDNENRNIYLSRKKAPTRKLLNEEELLQELVRYGFVPYFPEDHSIVETARAFASAKAVAGVHGSGFANLAFCSSGTKVIDFLAPKHLDPYYWILSNRTGSTYGYLFGRGERLSETADLVKNKIDEDIYIDPADLRKLLDKLSF